ncbi:MAG: tripartite tricarboxylate transporter TctB family protein [Bradyrhizobiaceae bacterium]|nr:tripartite tricarboxylate transporter TctB family protein [Bradyrhizobiaceae bacterium]
MSSRVNVKEVTAGLLCIVIGGFFALQSVTTLPIGSARQIGPGYFPFAVGLILIALGILIGLRAVQPAESSDRMQFVSVRTMLAILASPVVFGLSVRPLGLAPAIVITALVATLAGNRANVVQSLLLAAGLTIFCVAVFSYGLGLSLPLFGPLLARFGV